MRSQARHRTTPWAAGIGPSSTIRPRNARCVASSLVLGRRVNGLDLGMGVLTVRGLIVRGNRPHFPAIPLAYIERVIRLLAIFVNPRPTRCLTRQ
jgi:hypothetical protein